MKIGIDIDYTINDIRGKMLAYGQKFDREVNKGDNLVNPYAYYTDTMFNWSKETEDLFWSKYITEITDIEPRPFAKEVINKIKEQGNQIYIITARRHSGFQDPYIVSKDWFNKHEIKYDEIFVRSTEKAEVCLKLGIDIFIDDKPENCLEVSEVGIKTYMFDNFFNKDFKNDNIIRVYSWPDFYFKLEGVEKNKNSF